MTAERVAWLTLLAVAAVIFVFASFAPGVYVDLVDWLFGSLFGGAR